MALISSLSSFAQTIFSIALGLFGIGFIIGFHEMGHFLFCKLFGISTPSFSIGMGPKIYSKKIGETEFVFSALPLGGYVEIAGAQEVGQGEQKEAHRKDKHSFAVKPYYQKLLVLSGGIIFNVIFGYIVFTSLFFTGMPKFPMIYPKFATTTIESSPLNILKSGDRIIAINETLIEDSPVKVFKFAKNNPGKKATLRVMRENTEKNISVTIKERENKKKKKEGYLPINYKMPAPYPFLTSIKKGIQATNYMIGQLFIAVKNLFVTRNLNDIAGPVMLTTMTVQSALKGMKIFLLFLAIISINLAVFNVIPLPIMDGGQILFYTIEAIIRRPLPNKVREYIHYATWILVLLLFVILVFKDITRLWNGFTAK